MLIGRFTVFSYLCRWIIPWLLFIPTFIRFYVITVATINPVKECEQSISPTAEMSTICIKAINRIAVFYISTGWL